MAANQQPIFPLTPTVSYTSAAITGANTAKDGTGSVSTIVTAGTNGQRVDVIKIRALGTNVATVVRFFINNGSANSTPSNNSLFYEVTAPATTLSEVAAQADISLAFDGVNLPQLYLQSGYKINVTIGTAVAAGLQITCFSGAY